MNKTQYLAATKALKTASEGYYVTGDTSMSDSEYDQLLREVAEYETENGISGAKDSIASGANLGGNVTHQVKMLSLDNLYTPEDVSKWKSGIEEQSPGTKFIVEPKLDGLAMSVEFEDGKPVRMSTRGDGTSGEDTTAAMNLITNLPALALYDGTKLSGEVRGEVIFSSEQFLKANQARVESGGVEFANPRNACAGVVNRASKGGSVPTGTELSFIAYDAQGDLRTNKSGHSDLMDGLKSAGFTTALSLLEGKKITTDSKPEVGFELDGIVHKVDSFETQAKLGNSSRAPRWARAFKYPPDVVRTKLLDVLWQVGRTGVVTPRAVVAPVKVGGTTVKFATLNNPDDIARKGLMLGDTVEVRRAAEVIPEIRGPVESLRDGSEEVIDILDRCPNCGETLDTSQARLRCPSGGECALVRKLTYAVSRDALDIEGMSEALVSALVDEGKLNNVADIFVLSQEDVAKCPTGRVAESGSDILFGDTVAKKILKEIERAKVEATFDRVLIALSLAGTGRSMCKRLASHFGSMDNLLAASSRELSEVDKIGVVKADGLFEQLHTAEMLDTIERLDEYGVAMEVVQTSGPKPLEGQVIVVTGPMKTLGSRGEITSKLESLGAVVGSSVGSKTTLVVADDVDGSSSKLTKAKKVGVRVVDEDTFLTEFGLV